MNPMLELTDVHSGYGGTEVLFGLNLSIAQGEVATLGGEVEKAKR